MKNRARRRKRSKKRTRGQRNKHTRAEAPPSKQDSQRTHPLGFDECLPHPSELWQWKIRPRSTREAHGLSAEQIHELRRCATRTFEEEQKNLIGRSSTCDYRGKSFFYSEGDELTVLVDNVFCEQEHERFVRTLAAKRLIAISADAKGVYNIERLTPEEVSQRSNLVPDGIALVCELFLRNWDRAILWMSVIRHDDQGSIVGFSPAFLNELVAVPSHANDAWTLDMLTFHEFIHNHEAVAKFLKVPVEPYYVWKAKQLSSIPVQNDLRILHTTPESLSRGIRTVQMSALL